MAPPLNRGGAESRSNRRVYPHSAEERIHDDQDTTMGQQGPCFFDNSVTLKRTQLESIQRQPALVLPGSKDGKKWNTFDASLGVSLEKFVAERR